MGVKNTGSKVMEIRMAENWLKAVQAEAKRNRMTISEWVRSCIALNLPQQQQQTLTEMKRGRPKTK